MTAPVLATLAVLTRDGLTVDGQPFPFLIAADGVTIQADADADLATLTVSILVDGPVVVQVARDE